jgi:hypothetical protein
MAASAMVAIGCAIRRQLLLDRKLLLKQEADHDFGQAPSQAQ